MTPANICGMAYVKGLQLIAVTDHNTARNLPAVKQAADAYGIMLLPGIEVTTREEVHMLAYYPTVEGAMKAGAYFTAHLPAIKNKPQILGNQLVMNSEDQVMDEETALLIGATDLSLEMCVTYILGGGGVAVPAHINRGSNGLLVNLGFMPEQPYFHTVEIASHLPVAKSAISGRKILQSSDAHRLGDIAEAKHIWDTKDESIQGILDSLFS